MDYKILKLEVTEKIAIVTISRPEAMNALNSRFFQEMDAMIGDLSSRDDVGVAVVTGAGKAFVAGADIAEMVHMNQQEGTDFSKAGQKTFRGLELFEKPVIAAINGFALGGGLELALGCDFRIASSKAKFGQPEVNLGLIPGYAATQRLPRLIGLGNALYLLLSAELIDAGDALRMGLIQKVVEPEQLMEEVIGLAKKLLSKGPGAIKLIKKVTREGLLSDFEKGCTLESEKFGSLFENEGREGMKAFLEKRPPKWQE